jgi:hypothetical protein
LGLARLLALSSLTVLVALDAASTPTTGIPLGRAEERRKATEYWQSGEQAQQAAAGANSSQGAGQVVEVASIQRCPPWNEQAVATYPASSSQSHLLAAG